MSCSVDVLVPWLLRSDIFTFGFEALVDGENSSEKPLIAISASLSSICVSSTNRTRFALDNLLVARDNPLNVLLLIVVVVLPIPSIYLWGLSDVFFKILTTFFSSLVGVVSWGDTGSDVFVAISSFWIGKTGISTGWTNLATGWTSKRGLGTGWAGETGLVTDWAGKTGLVTGWAGKTVLVVGWAGETGLVTGWAGETGIVTGWAGETGLVTDWAGKTGLVTDWAGKVTGWAGKTGLATGLKGKPGLAIGSTIKIGSFTVWIGRLFGVSFSSGDGGGESDSRLSWGDELLDDNSSSRFDNDGFIGTLW